MDRDKLLDAALEEFSEIGITSSSLSSIAERAGFDVPAVRAIFVDKESILRTLLQEITEPIVSAVTIAAEEAEDPASMMRRSLPLLDQWLIDNPRYTRLMLRCMLEKGEVVGILYEHSLYPSEFFEQLQRFIDAGKIRQRDLALVGVLLDSLIFMPHLVRPALTLLHPGKTDEEIFAQHRNAVFELLEGGLFSR